MVKFLIRFFFFAAFVVAIRLVVGHFYPDLGGKAVKEAVAKVVPIHHLMPLKDQVPLAVGEYQRLGFPAVRTSGSWVKQDLADFREALDSLPHDYRGNFPGADGDYGKSAFLMITRLEATYKLLPLEEQAAIMELVGRIHEAYRHAYNFERIRYDREIALLRGVYVAMTGQFLEKIEMDLEHARNQATDLAGILGLETDEVKLERRILADAIFQYTSDSMAPGLFETRKEIEGLVEETLGTSTFRPQAVKLTLRYFEGHLASISKRIGGDYKKTIEKGYRRSSDPEIKELYRRILVSFDEVRFAQ